MGKSWKFSRGMTILFVCSLFLVSGNAKASDYESVWIFAIAGIAVGVVVGSGGIICALGDLSYVIKGEKPGDNLITASWTFAGLNALAGVAFLIASEGNDDPLLWSGVGYLAIAAIDVGFVIWASRQPERPEQKLTLAPMIMPDARGRPAFGVGLRLVDW